jgi:CubicO group peptidase (beta-lactamase class C family)
MNVRPIGKNRRKRSPFADMLAMRSGLDCGFLPGEQELELMRRTKEWVKFALALPMKYAPGEKFGYCSPGYHLLSSVITAASHEPLVDFGKKNLFEPLGIKDVVWPPDEQGRTHGFSNINRYSAVIHFEGDAVQVTISESSGLIRNGHLVGKKV